MRFGSICSGIEAASVAWHPLGWQAAWLTEIEPFPSAVLAHHYPEVPNYGDMTALPARIASGEVEAPDVLCGGTPCQAFSVAGLRKSLDDARGNLSLIFCDIADEIDTIRAIRGEPPVVIVWENVPGVLSTKDNAFGCLLGQLAGEDGPLEPPGDRWTNAGCVFGPKRAVAWRVLDAQYFGLAQRRRRVFVVASARLGFDPTTVLFESDGLRRDSAPSREPGQGIAPDIAPCLVSSGRGIGRTGDTRGQDPVVAVQSGRRAVGDAFANCGDFGVLKAVQVSDPLRAKGGDCGGGSETLISMGDAVGFQSSQSGIRVVDVHATLDANNGSRRHNGVVTMAHGEHLDKVVATLDASYGRLQGCSGQDGDHGYSHLVAFDTTQITSPGNVSSPKYGDACHPLAAGAHPPAVAFQSNASFSSGVAVDLSPTIRVGSSGGGQPPAIAYSTKLHNTTSNQAGKIYEEYTVSLDCNSPPPALLTAMQVRRLTPMECERLQGFPDNYTDIPWKTAQEALRKGISYESLLLKRGMTLRGPNLDDCPDGPRYKALGNSWAVPCVRWIGRRIDNACRAVPINSINSTEDDEL